jgi:hypothetical protein
MFSARYWYLSIASLNCDVGRTIELSWLSAHKLSSAASHSLWRMAGTLNEHAVVAPYLPARANVLSAVDGGSCHLHVMIGTFGMEAGSCSFMQLEHPSPTCCVRQCHLPMVNW